MEKKHKRKGIDEAKGFEDEGIYIGKGRRKW